MQLITFMKLSAKLIIEDEYDRNFYDTDSTWTIGAGDLLHNRIAHQPAAVGSVSVRECDAKRCAMRPSVHSRTPFVSDCVY